MNFFVGKTFFLYRNFRFKFLQIRRICSPEASAFFLFVNECLHSPSAFFVSYHCCTGEFFCRIVVVSKWWNISMKLSCINPFISRLLFFVIYFYTATKCKIRNFWYDVFPNSSNFGNINVHTWNSCSIPSVTSSLCCGTLPSNVQGFSSVTAHFQRIFLCGIFYGIPKQDTRLRNNKVQTRV